MQDHLSQLTAMIKKNTDAVNNLRLALQKKKDRKVRVLQARYVNHSVILLTIGSRWPV